MKIISMAQTYTCEYQHCDQSADGIAFDRNIGEVGFYCNTHLDVVAEHGYPEYISQCPNCSCLIPVN
jgi:hypothetical protein